MVRQPCAILFLSKLVHKVRNSPILQVLIKSLLIGSGFFLSSFQCKCYELDCDLRAWWCNLCCQNWIQLSNVKVGHVVCVEWTIPSCNWLWEEVALIASNHGIIHPANELRKDASNAHILEQEEVKLIGIEVSDEHHLGSGCTKDADCALEGSIDQLINSICRTIRSGHQGVDPIPMIIVNCGWIHILNPNIRQAMARSLTEHPSPRHSHEAVVFQHALVAWDPIPWPHCREDLGSHEIILDYHRQRPEINDLRNVTSHAILLSRGINPHCAVRDCVLEDGLEDSGQHIIVELLLIFWVWSSDLLSPKPCRRRKGWIDVHIFNKPDSKIKGIKTLEFGAQSQNSMSCYSALRTRGVPSTINWAAAISNMRLKDPANPYMRITYTKGIELRPP